MSWLDKAADFLKENAKAELISGFHCFVLNRDDFHDFRKIIVIEGELPEPLLQRKGFENFRLSLSSADRHEYIICTPAEPILDLLWNEMHAPEKEKPEDAKT